MDGEKSTVPLSISFSPMGLVKFQLLTNFDMALRQNEALLGTDGETEKLKQMLFETNPYLLGLTLFVSLLHSCFDILAFKNGKASLSLGGLCCARANVAERACR